MNLPPYIEKRFTATSGNICLMKLWIKRDGTVADCDWETPSSHEDQAEAARFLATLVHETFPDVAFIAAASVTGDDEAERQRMLRDALIPGHDGSV